jgi:DNA-binding transcriptional ArsR family regulator
LLKELPVKGIAAPPTNLQALADRLKVLAEPKRLLILHMLIEGVQCNCELGDALKMPPNLISHGCISGTERQPRLPSLN